MVEKNEHQRAGAGAARLRAAKSRTAKTCSRLTSNHPMMSSMLAPASRFSKTVATGMLVPPKTQAPHTLPGMLSTSGHCDQSSGILLSLDYLSLSLARGFRRLVPFGLSKVPSVYAGPRPMYSNQTL